MSVQNFARNLLRRGGAGDAPTDVFVFITDPNGVTTSHVVEDGSALSYQWGAWSFTVEHGEQAPVVAWQEATT